MLKILIPRLEIQFKKIPNDCCKFILVFENHFYELKRHPVTAFDMSILRPT
jgi:hypothetical protein